jgi:hypothetical protein
MAEEWDLKKDQWVLMWALDRGEDVLEVSSTTSQGRVLECSDVTAGNKKDRWAWQVRAMDDTEAGKSGENDRVEDVPSAGTKRCVRGVGEGHAPEVV